jgi:molybdate transport system substrate-binding protein
LLSAASSIYLPDPVRSTAGIHCMKVFTALGLAASQSARFRTFANGATAMRAMADAGDTKAVGITQCSEILYTEGVRLIGPLPSEFALTTVYSAAITTDASDSALAARLLNALAAASARTIRLDAGFEPVDCDDPRIEKAVQQMKW